MFSDWPDAPPFAVPSIVIDTNVVLDMLVFQDARVRALHRHLVSGHLLWLGTEAMMEELADVLNRPLILRVCPDSARTLACARSLCRLVPTPEVSGLPAPVCADPDDQIFIDLAWCWPATWLLTRDRALLKLATRAKVRQIHILTPANWPGLDSARSAPA